MSSLTQISITTRKIISYGIFFIIFLIIGRILLSFGITIYKKLFPPPPPPPTVKFGKLPKLPFPETQKPANISFALETPEGSLPKFPPQMKVYFMLQSTSNLMSLETAKTKANALGFSTEEQKVSDTVYQFRAKEVPSKLDINIVSGVFSISYDLQADATPLDKRPQGPQIAVSEVKGYLSGAGLLPADLTGPTKTYLLKLENKQLVTALSLSDTSLVKVHLFRKSFDNYPSLTANPDEANIWFLVSGADQKEKQIMAAEYHYFPVDEKQSSTYTIKDSQTAWNEFLAGEWFLAKGGEVKEGDSIKIRRVYLAYFDSGEPTEFFQPIVVFEGDKGFMGYLPAITQDYYGE